MAAAIMATTCTADAVIITVGIGAAATTSAGTTAVIAIIIAESSLYFAFVTHCPGDVRMQRCEQVAPSRRGRFSRG